MADHMWFIPVTGGSRRAIESVSRPGYGGSDDTNVQWDFSVFPVNVQPRPEIACINMSSYNTFIQGDETPKAAALRECYGSWGWRSCAAGDPLRIITGGQLMVGTVFSRKLIIDMATPAYDVWDMVEVWAKYRVLASSIDVLDEIYLSINDSGTLTPISQVLKTYTSVNTWTVGYVRSPVNYEWEDWDDDNLRVTLNFQGTSTAANVGKVTVDVEWFAIRLSDQA